MNKIKSYGIMLQRHIDKKDFVKIIRTFKGREEDISGFMLMYSNDFILLQIDNELMRNGYAVIPKHQFDSIRCNRYDRTLKKIYKQEGLLNTQYGIDQPISLKSWQELFSSLKKLDYHIIVECEDKDEPDFNIGPIKSIYKDKVGIQYYDPTGRLDNKPTTIKFSDITIVRFGDRYSTTFRKYLRTGDNKTA
jgi:hypothetical protein